MRSYMVVVLFCVLLLLWPSEAAGCDLRSLARAGDCQFYQCVEQRMRCGSSGYPLGYGYKYCTKYGTYYSSFTSQGKQWVDNVRGCLMRALIRPVETRVSCGNLINIAFNSHPSCYVNSPPGFCTIVRSWRNLNALRKVLLGWDLFSPRALRQVYNTLRSCVG